MITAMLALIAFGTVTFLAGLGRELPVFPGAQKLGGEIRYEGLTASVYTFDNDPRDVLEFYETKMYAEGWEITEQSGFGEGYGDAIFYSKGSEVAFVYIFYHSQSLTPYGGSGPGMFFILGRGNLA